MEKEKAKHTNEEIQDTVENADTATAEQDVEIVEAVKTPEEEIKELNDKYLRLYAEFENYKRRTTKERIDLFKSANQEMLVAVLPVLDDFERAQKSFIKATDVLAVKEGVDLVFQKLKSILTQKGLKEMEVIGTEFDADIHEAITNIPAPSEEQKGKVIDQMEKGYYLHDKVIRFAKVIVGA